MGLGPEWAWNPGHVRMSLEVVTHDLLWRTHTIHVAMIIILFPPRKNKTVKKCNSFVKSLQVWRWSVVRKVKLYLWGWHHVSENHFEFQLLSFQWSSLWMCLGNGQGDDVRLGTLSYTQETCLEVWTPTFSRSQILHLLLLEKWNSRTKICFCHSTFHMHK